MSREEENGESTARIGRTVFCRSARLEGRFDWLPGLEVRGLVRAMSVEGSELSSTRSSFMERMGCCRDVLWGKRLAEGRGGEGVGEGFVAIRLDSIGEGAGAGSFCSTE